MTERKSSGICDAPASAVSETAAASGPSDASVSRAARRGEDCAGLKTDVRSSGVAFALAGSGVPDLAAGAGAAAVWEREEQKRRKLHVRKWKPGIRRKWKGRTWCRGLSSPEEELVVASEGQQRLAREGHPHVRDVLLVVEERRATRASLRRLGRCEIPQLCVRKVLQVEVGGRDAGDKGEAGVGGVACNGDRLVCVGIPVSAIE